MCLLIITSWCIILLILRSRCIIQATHCHSAQSTSSCNLCQLVGTQDDTTIVPSRDWARFLSSHFRRLDGIKKYHHFHFERNHPGVVFLKKTATAEEEMQCLLRVCGYHLQRISLPLSFLPAYFLKDKNTCMTRSGSTAKRTVVTWFVFFPTLPVMISRMLHRQSI